METRDTADWKSALRGSETNGLYFPSRPERSCWPIQTFVKKSLVIGLVVVGLALVAAILLSDHGPKPVLYQGKSAEAWALQLTSLDPQAHAAATNAVKALGPKAVPNYLYLLRTDDPFFRKQTWAVAPKLPRPLTQHLLRYVKPLHSQSARLAVVQALALLGPEARATIPALAHTLREPDPQLRWEAAKALAAVGPEAVPALADALNDPTPQVRTAAIAALIQLGPQAEAAVPALLQKLHDPDESVRTAAANCLGRIGMPELSALAEMLKQGRGTVRENSLQLLLLAHRSLRSTLPELVKLAREESPALRRQAVEALGELRVTDPAVVRTLMAALQDPSAEVRTAAARALGQVAWKGPSIEPALAGALNDRSAPVRQAAAQALGSLGDPAQAAVPELQRLLQDPEDAVRDAAREALKRLGTPNYP